MSDNLQMVLVTSRLGRIVLHLACLGHGHIDRHLKGILHEILLVGRANPFA